MTSLMMGCTPESEATEPSSVVQPAVEKPAPDSAYYCGGQTTQVKARQFFSDLRAVLRDNSPPAAFNRFVDSTFWVIRGNRRIAYNLADFISATPRFISREDWERISERGLVGLDAVGWRGCMMDNGKVWIDADDEKGLLLRGINHDMDWKETGAAR